MTGLQPAGLPHSDIPGSKPVCGSPGLFAAYHVLPRLLKPRHPPFALLSFLSRESDISLCHFFAFSEIAVPNKYGNKSTRFFFHYRLLFFFFLLYLVIFLNIVNELLFSPSLFLKRAAKIRTFFLLPNFSEHFFKIFFRPNMAYSI